MAELNGIVKSESELEADVIMKNVQNSFTKMFEDLGISDMMRDKNIPNILDITSREIDPFSHLFANMAFKMFYNDWQKREIYDYGKIQDFTSKIKSTPDSRLVLYHIMFLNWSLNRVDIDGQKFQFTSESLVARLEQFKKESPKLKEINLSNLSIKNINTLLSFPNIKSVSNLRIDKIDSQTTHLIFERMIQLHDQFGDDFIFDVYHSFYYAKHGDSEDSEFEDEDTYHIKYDHGTLLYDNIKFDFRDDEESFHEKVLYLKKMIQKLRPHTIETYGACITTSLMACDSIKTIVFKDHNYSIHQEYDLTFESLLYFNKEYMDILHPDKKDEIQLIKDDEGNIMSEDDMREEGYIPKIIVNNCSVESILYTPLDLNKESYMEKEGEYDYIFPTITKFTMPMEVCHLQDTMNTYPNVKTLYYYPPTEMMILRKKDDLTSLINNNSHVNFIPYER
jgi:hypothetical protein